ncbi:MAG: hypothetical protein VX873_08630 [Pseudomonadota bacterium]|nr:hypothetical protein [Pseudomonadota bacterium]
MRKWQNYKCDIWKLSTLHKGFFPYTKLLGIRGKLVNFYEQSIEMKRTLLEASIGRVTIAANGLESSLKLVISILTTDNDESFEKEYNKIRTLGVLIQRAVDLDIFDNLTNAMLRRACKIRNEFTHALSEKYTNSINSQGSMYDLIQEFVTFREELNQAAHAVNQKLNEMASNGGVNLDDVKTRAKKALQAWENA